MVLLSDHNLAADNKLNKKLFKNYLTNRIKYDIIYIVKNKKSPKKGINSYDR